MFAGDSWVKICQTNFYEPPEHNYLKLFTINNFVMKTSESLGRSNIKMAILQN